MKNKQVKGFTFKTVAKQARTTGLKARDGVAIAGCTGVITPWGFDVQENSRTVPGRDNGGPC